jgi:hypothetical protein
MQDEDISDSTNNEQSQLNQVDLTQDISNRPSYSDSDVIPEDIAISIREEMQRLHNRRQLYFASTNPTPNLNLPSTSSAPLSLDSVGSAEYVFLLLFVYHHSSSSYTF